jgi:transposase
MIEASALNSILIIMAESRLGSYQVIWECGLNQPNITFEFKNQSCALAAMRCASMFAWKGVTKVIHAIADNYATHKHPNFMKWLTDHPRWTFHFTPTSASWLNAVEGFFSTVTRLKIRRGVFKSVADLQDAIKRYVKAHNQTSKPCVWTASAPVIFEKLAQIPAPSD